jgi:hypothetical protein
MLGVNHIGSDFKSESINTKQQQSDLPQIDSHYKETPDMSMVEQNSLVLSRKTV